MSIVKFNEFARALLFGREYYEIPNHILIQQLVMDLDKHVHVKEAIQNGGLLLSSTTVNQDLNTILNYLKEGVDGRDDERHKPIKLKSQIAKNFFNQLSALCKGDLKYGIVANSYEMQRQQDWKAIDDMIRNESFVTLPLLGLENPKISDNMLRRAVTLYDLKCKSLGRLVDPFSFVLAPQLDYVDAVHWKTDESLVQFCERYSRNPLALRIRNLLDSTLRDFLNGKEALPLLTLETRTFLRNINHLNEKIEKVESDRAPPKLVDLFQRLLALLRLDHLWTREPAIVVREEKEADPFVAHLFGKNLELERENALLKGIIAKKS